MIWTVLGYEEMEGIESVPFISTFQGSHTGKEAIKQAQEKFKNVKVFAVVAGNHSTSSYVYEP